MTVDIAVVLGILVAAMILFVTERVRVDVVALMVMISLALTGILTPEQAVSGFSNPAVITVWAVFILSGGLSRTGVAGMLGKQVLRVAGASEIRLIMVIMLVAAFLSAFMNNVGVAALLLPVVMDVARRTNTPPSKLLIPLAFSSLLGGLTTLIGTPPNILVAAALTGSGFETFALFDFTPVGTAVVAAGILYMALVGRRLLPSRDPVRDARAGRDDVELDEVYGLRERLFALDVQPDSPLVGKSLGETRVEGALGLHVMGIIRDDRTDLAPSPDFLLAAGDRLVVQGPDDSLREIGAREYLALETEEVPLEELISDEVRLAEVHISEGSEVIGRTLRGLDFRHRFGGCLVLSVWRDGAPLRTHLATTRLTQGDILLVHGYNEMLDRIGESADFEVSPIFDPLVYEIEGRLMYCRVPEDSPLVGQTLSESRLGDVFSLGIMGIERGGTKELIPLPEHRLEAGDRLLVKGRPEDLDTVEGLWGLPVDTSTTRDFADLESDDVCLAELVLSPRSTVAGRTLVDVRFRDRFGMNVVAVMRGGTVYRDLRYFPLRFGDALLIHGPRGKLELLADDPDFLIITGEVEEVPLTRRAPLSALLMAGVVGSVIAGWVPIYIAAVTGAVLMVLTRCLTMDEAYRAIEWQAVFLIAGMLPLGLALGETGAADLLTRGVVGTVGGLGPIAVVAALYILSAMCAQVMPTAAVAILVAPIALNTAADLGLSPHALMMTVALSASASFMSPVAHPANVLIMGPGGYRFTDYIKVGLPLTIICLLVTVLLLPIFWPLTP
ncbi:MAG: SLC13 family permease [Gemmatimonadota bacterium]|nr:SLC13 family permease [Gemmatimonadota bacterium]